MKPDSELDSLERFAFGDGPELADSLLDLVLARRKTATCWAVRDGQITRVGKRMIALDGGGDPRAVLQTVALSKCRFGDVGPAFAAAEGEGDLSLEWWREAHRRYFERNGGFAPDMLLWCEHFRLLRVLPKP